MYRAEATAQAQVPKSVPAVAKKLLKLVEQQQADFDLEDPEAGGGGVAGRFAECRVQAGSSPCPEVWTSLDAAARRFLAHREAPAQLPLEAASLSDSLDQAAAWIEKPMGATRAGR